MTAEEFVRLVGPTLVHITPASNLAGIQTDGLLPAATLAARAGVPADDILLRADRRLLRSPAGTAQLNHQRPLRMGLNKAADFLDGHTPQSWAAQLDRRIFLWPARKGAAFAASLAQQTAVLTLDARRLFDALAGYIDLSPINSGNAQRRPARRGDWLYVPALSNVEAFRENRRARGLVRTRDSVTEVSLTAPLPAAILRALTA